MTFIGCEDFLPPLLLLVVGARGPRVLILSDFLFLQGITSWSECPLLED